MNRLLLITATLLCAALCGCDNGAPSTPSRPNTPGERRATVAEAFHTDEIASVTMNGRSYSGYHFIVRDSSGVIWYAEVQEPGQIYSKERLLGAPGKP